MEGYLELIIGPMFSGKTSKLLDMYKQCQFCNIDCVIINHSLDNRYHHSMLTSHDDIKAPCVMTNSLFDVWNNMSNEHYHSLKKAQVILINEGQFFDDLYVITQDMLNNNKRIYICGLDGDFEQKQFGQILNLIPICDMVNKLTSLCSICKNGKSGIFSMRTSSETNQTVIGSSNYLPVCRECYNKNHYQYQERNKINNISSSVFDI